MSNQELDECRVITAQPVVAAEPSRFTRTELAVVAPSALGDVVEQRCDVQDPWLVPLRGELRAERVLMRVLGDEEAPRVAHHHQDVLVHRVDVEQVVLHATHDAPEDPQVSPEHRGLVHQPHRPRHALRLPQDVHEELTVDRVAPEATVHQVARVVQRAQRACRQALDAGGLLEDQEGLEDGVRVVGVEPVVANLQHAAAVEEARVDRPHRRVAGPEDALLQVQQQDLVELGHGLRGPVVAVHQQLGRALRPRGAVTEAGGHGGLQIEDEAVLAPLRHHVQVRPYQLQHALVLAELARLERRQQASRGHLGPCPPEPRGPRDPDQHLQVAQAPGTLLAVGLQRVGRALVLDVALLHLQGLGPQEGCRVHRGRGRFPELLVGTARTGDPPRLQQRGLDGHVAPCLVDALGDRAHRGPNLEPDVPARGDEGLDGVHGRPSPVGPRVGQQQQHVDVRVREELPSTEAAHGDQRCPLGQSVRVPQAAQGVVDMPGQVAQQSPGRGGHRARRAKLVDQGLLALPEPGSQGGKRGRRHGRGQPLHAQASAGAGRTLSVATKSGGGGLPADRVSTSYPLSVTSTVCSHCADSERSRVTMVQPS